MRLRKAIREAIRSHLPGLARRQIKRFVWATQSFWSVVRESVWTSLPERIRRKIRNTAARKALGIKGRAQPSAPELLRQRYEQVLHGTAVPLHGHEIELATVSDADEMIKWSLLIHGQKGDAGLRAYMDGFRYCFPAPPDDPFSRDYRDFWMAQYEAMAQKKYAVENEHHDFHLDSLRKTPHPYNTRNQQVIAAHIIAAGAILEAIPASPPARILEMGVGFGNTALQIGLSGYDVTVLDIEKKHLEIVAERFEREGMNVRCLHMEFMDISKLDEQFDAIIFYECFHHCIDHPQLLLILRERLTAGGVIIFAGETISEDLPFAWGLNFTGQGIWSIRRHGWMELVFKESYFVELLERSGFVVTHTMNPHSAHSWVFIARVQPAG